MNYFKLIMLAIGSVIAFILAWSIQGIRYERDIANMKAQAATEQAQAVAHAKQESELLQAKKDEALDAANKRAKINESRAAGAQSVVDELRSQLDAAGRENNPFNANPNYGSTLTTVLGQCTAELVTLAKAADGHASDSLMYQQAWPK